MLVRSHHDNYVYAQCHYTVYHSLFSSIHNFLSILVLGVIGFTLQPLWPDSSKMGMWFLSVIMMVLLGVLIALYIGNRNYGSVSFFYFCSFSPVRWVLYALIYTFSSGKVVFWLLPNLDDEKLGVIDSFKPLYSLKFKKKKKKQDKTSDTVAETELTSKKDE